MTAALEGDEWSAAGPGRTLPPGKTRYPFYRRLCGPQGRSGWAENLVPTGIASPFYLLEIIRCPLYRRLDGPQGWSGQVRKISPPPRFDPRSVQPNCTAVTHVNSVSERKARNYSASNIQACSLNHGCDT